MQIKSKRVLVSGNFYLLHPGHLRFLKFAAELGNELFIGINPSRPSDEYPSVEERVDALSSLKLAHKVFPLVHGIEIALKEIRPEIVVKGKEFRTLFNPEESIIASWGGRLVFSSGESTYFDLGPSHTEPDRLNLRRVDNYLKRHNCSRSNIELILDRIKSQRILVVGDAIVDEYVDCDALGMSREDPTLVIAPLASQRFVGGAAIVAAHAAALGATVDFISIVGEDEPGEFVRVQLEKYGVNTKLTVDDTRPTTLKLRYRVDGRTILRVSHLRQHEASESIQGDMLQGIASGRTDYTVAILSDFNYGVLTSSLVNQLIPSLKLQGCYVAADSQSSSQIGDISRFKDIDLITPTEHEARIALRDQASGLSFIAHKLITQTAVKRAIITLGRSGLLAIEALSSSDELKQDQLEALNPQPSDVSGAGDSLLVMSAISSSLGASAFEASFLGSICAAIQTSRVGNVPISLSDVKSVVANYFSAF
jgi:rfaE bifunctional protein kinase chain/domain